MLQELLYCRVWIRLPTWTYVTSQHTCVSLTFFTFTQDPDSVVPSMHPISLAFSSFEAERRFRSHHVGVATRCDIFLDAMFAALYFSLLVPCLDAWGMDANPSAPSTFQHRLTSLATSFFVLLAIGPLVVAASQLDWAGTHRKVLRYVGLNVCFAVALNTYMGSKAL